MKRTFVRFSKYLSTEMLSMSMGVVTAFVAVGAISSYFEAGTQISDRPNDSSLKVERAHTDFQISLLQSEIKDLRKTISEAGQLPIQDAALQEKLTQVDRIAKELAELKSVILEDPAKALSLPLMRKDMADLNKRQDAISASVETQINRIYDFSKWFLALMITLAVGMVTMGFFRPKKDGA